MSVKTLTSFLKSDSPQIIRGGTSGVFYKEFGEKVKDSIKHPSTAEKHLRFYVKKNKLNLLNLPSLGARDVLVVPVKEKEVVSFDLRTLNF